MDSNNRQREPFKTPCEMEMELDKISNLPAHIIDQILSQLPIKDAVRTSILSNKWRYKWTKLPYLVFDNQCVSLSAQDPMVVKNKVVNILDHVLLLHCGPIYKFKLSHRDLLGGTDIDRWILYLSRGVIKEFVLEIWKGQRYKMPSCLFSFQSLIHLELFNCFLKPPSTFKGFGSLKTLDLQHVSFTQDVFESMISSCPVLERLTLMNFDGFTHLKINAPNLQFFDIGGVFKDVSFENTLNLAVVSIGLYANVNLVHGSSSNLHKFLLHLPQLQRLEVQSYFLKYLAAGIVKGKLPTAPCLNLNYLSIRINFSDADEVLTSLCLLKTCPNLQELEILARPDEQAVVQWKTKIWVEDYRNCLFHQLRLIKVVGISGMGQEMDFINFLLSTSVVLERMTVKPASTSGGLELIKELLRYRRASVQAEIIYLDP